MGTTVGGVRQLLIKPMAIANIAMCNGNRNGNGQYSCQTNALVAMAIIVDKLDIPDTDTLVACTVFICH